MKIFNWVQRKLHQNVIKEGVERSVKKKEASEIEKNTKAILQQVGLVDALENWVDGVLAIGTFGFDTLKYSHDKESNGFFAEEEHQEDQDDQEEENDCESLDLDVRDEGFTKNSVIIYQDEELDPLISAAKFDENVPEAVGSDKGGDLTDSELIRAVDCVDLAGVDHRGKKKRTTLAELFMEEGDTQFKKSLNPLEKEWSYGKYKLKGPKLSHLLFAKKIMSRATDQDSRPIKKLHQMMKKMLKKKIHPDVDAGKVCKSEGANKPIKKSEAVESIHLLNITDPAA